MDVWLPLVFLVVMGLALMMFSAFGEAAQPEHDDSAIEPAHERSGP